jgi:hypothetical protein
LARQQVRFPDQFPKLSILSVFSERFLPLLTKQRAGHAFGDHGLCKVSVK